jgi:hypothetical protein
MKIPFFGKKSTVEVVDSTSKKMRYSKEWVCQSCPNDPSEGISPAKLVIRGNKDRDHGRSNFEGVHTTETVNKYKLGERYVGHSIVPSGDLNWDGLAEERNWILYPHVKCPACQKNMSVDEYKDARRNGLL